MIFATQKNKTRDGQLLVVAQDRKRAATVAEIPNLQFALDHQAETWPILEKEYAKLNDQKDYGMTFSLQDLLAPLPRAYEWIDGSAFINHIILVRKARKAEIPETLETDPLVYQGGSGTFLAPTEDIPLVSEDHGLDLEAEVCVVTTDVPLGTKRDQAADKISLLMLCNDVSLRNLIPAELKKGFGFLVSKPSSAFSPFALTPDELEPHFKGGRLYLDVHSEINGTFFGNPNAGEEMHFSFYDLIQHICQTRPLCAGSIIGSGTVSNKDRSRGSSCLAEKRMLEIIESGKATTAFLKDQDTVKIWSQTPEGKSLFGAIEQRVKKI